MLENLRPTPEMLIEWRRKYDYSQKELADYLAEPLERVRKWEQGAEKIPITVRMCLVDPDFIW